MFLLGAVAGVVAMLTVQHLRDKEENQDHAALADKMEVHLEELEGRLAAATEERAS